MFAYWLLLETLKNQRCKPSRPQGHKALRLMKKCILNLHVSDIIFALIKARS